MNSHPIEEIVDVCWESSLSEEIDNLVLLGHMHCLETICLYFFLDKVTIIFNVLRSLVENKISSNMMSHFIVTKQCSRFFALNLKIMKKSSQPN